MTTDEEIQDKLKFDLHIEFQEVISFAITKGGYMKEGNMPKASNCQIEINKHQENIKNIFQEMLDLKAKNTIKNKSQELRKRNPYPEDIFIPLTKEKIKTYTLLMQNHGFSPDSYAGHLMRLAWNNCSDELEKMEKE